MSDRTGDSRSGFTLIEIMVATLVLTFGVLALAGMTGFTVRLADLGSLTTERSMARYSVVEQIRAQDLANVTAGSTHVGRYTVEWRVLESGTLYKTVRVVTTGPGVRSVAGSTPRLQAALSDSIDFQMVDLGR